MSKPEDIDMDKQFSSQASTDRGVWGGTVGHRAGPWPREPARRSAVSPTGTRLPADVHVCGSGLSGGGRGAAAP